MRLDKQIKKLREHFRKYGAIPTYEEMAKLFGYKSKSTAYYTVNKLIKEKYLKRDSKGNLIPGENFRGVPYFQSVKAGFPGPAEEEANDRMSLDQFMIDKPNSTILIKVKGDSMDGAGIFDGDVVIVERAPKAGIGETIVVNLEGEFTVKKLEKRGQRYVLAAANPDYPDLPLDKYTESSLIGIVKGVVRKF